MEGNKPKQQREKPVDKQNTLNLNEELKTPVFQQQEGLVAPPDYTPKAFYTKKQTSKAKRKKLRKIAKKSRLINRRRANGK